MIGWFLVLTHTLDRGVLLVSLDGDVRISERAALSQQFTDLVRMYLPRAVVMEIGASVVSAAALSTVLRAQRLCDQAGAARGGGRRPGHPRPAGGRDGRPRTAGARPRPRRGDGDRLTAAPASCRDGSALPGCRGVTARPRSRCLARRLGRGPADRQRWPASRGRLPFR
ncbi:hypothetical protein ACFQ60_09795 [Streptomyces zhihengii]